MRLPSLCWVYQKFKLVTEQSGTVGCMWVRWR